MENEHTMGGESKMYHGRISPVVMLVAVIVVLFSFCFGVMFGEIRGQLFCGSSGSYGSFGPSMMYRVFNQDGSYGSLLGPGMMWGGKYQSGGSYQQGGQGQQQQLSQPPQEQESVPSAQTVQ